MWQQIRSNKRKSAVLVAVMMFVLAALGFAIGGAIYQPVMDIESMDRIVFEFTGAYIGAAVAGLIALIMAITAYFGGTGILMGSVGARRIEKHHYPQLFNVVEEMTIASGLGQMPAVYIIDDPAPNAFATGRDPKHSAVAVTRGLLQSLNRDQLQGVIAHEIAHIVNRDVLFMQMMGVMLGAIVMMSEMFLRGLFRTGGRRRSRSSSGGGGPAQLIMLVAALILAILAPILANIIYFAASRRREYLADAQAAVFTRYPEGLASALEVISGVKERPAFVTRATAPMFIYNPMDRAGLMAGSVFSTHPPAEERIRILRGMAGAASYTEYQRAAGAISSRATLPPGALGLTGGEPIRAPHPDSSTAPEPKAAARAAGDAVLDASGFRFVPCSCGLRVKIPPAFTAASVQCPRCQSLLAVPGGAQAPPRRRTGQPVVRVAELAENQPASVEITRPKNPGWTTYTCGCGKPFNLSPGFQAERLRCANCGRVIHVRGE